MIQKNVGGVDKYARIISGLILVAIGHKMGILWATLIGAVLFFTGWFSWCGLYAFFGKSTCKNPPSER